jgi:hypothetical protein
VVVVAKGRKSSGLLEKSSGSKNRVLWWLHFTNWTSEFIVSIVMHGKVAVVADEVDSGRREEAALPGAAKI